MSRSPVANKQLASGRPSLKSIEIVAGAVFDAAGRVLIAQRPVGKELAGRWEFPGGKLRSGEAPYDGLVRELREELGIEVAAAERLLRYPYEYPDKVVWLDVWTVTSWSGDVQSLDDQALEWVTVDTLPTIDLLEADAPIVVALRNFVS